MNTSIFSVIYPQSVQYFDEFIASLSKQTDKDFILYLANDGVPDNDLETILGKFSLNVRVANFSGSPSYIRKKAIGWVKDQNIDYIIFADSDDYFSSNRVERTRELLVKHDIIVNDLVLVGDTTAHQVPLLSKRFHEGEEITALKISEANCMGLSNTGMRVKRIPAFFSSIPDDIIAFDWAFFTLALKEGANALFTATMNTYYRQHSANIAAPYVQTEEQILTGIKVKRTHYRFISQFYQDFEQDADEFDHLYAKLSSDTTLKERYCSEFRKQSAPDPLWWESVKPLKRLGL